MNKQYAPRERTQAEIEDEYVRKGMLIQADLRRKNEELSVSLSGALEQLGAAREEVARLRGRESEALKVIDQWADAHDILKTRYIALAMATEDYVRRALDILRPPKTDEPVVEQPSTPALEQELQKLIGKGGDEVRRRV